MKILFMLPGMSFGGAERVVSILANEFQRQGDQVHILTLASTEKSVYYLRDGIVRHGIILENGKNLKLVLNHLRLIRKKVHEIKPDIILSFITDTAIMALISTIGLKYPIIVCERNDPSKEFLSIKFKVLRKILYPLASGFVFQSEGARSYFSKAIQKKSTIILNPLVIQNIPDKYSGVRKKEIVSVGRLEPQKNQKLLIESFAKFHRTHTEYSLIIYGEGTLKQQLIDTAYRLNIQQYVHLAGTVDNVFEKISTASIFAFTSNYEGIPNALIEAMAVGLPCVSTNCSPGGAAMLINNYYNGILTPVNDIDEFVKALEYMVNNPLEAEKMGNYAMNIIEEVNAEKIVSEWRKYIAEII